MRNIVLVGFMGTGKTVIAKALSRETGSKYVSTDDLIEEREKKPITDIFSEQGEEYFRKVEKDVVREVSGRTGQVIDAGGGVVLDEENVKNLKKNGVMICLWADPATIWERTRSYGHRPLLEVDDPLGRIKGLLELRRPFYEKADFHIDTTDLDVRTVVERIKKIVYEKEGR
jgi:shikimate kinase